MKLTAEELINKHLTLKVLWFSDRPDENDDNDGKHFGIYIFDCLEKDYDEEAGYGSYDILEVFWFNNEDHRDREFNCI